MTSPYLDGILVSSDRCGSKVVCFQYNVGSCGSVVQISYTKTYPTEEHNVLNEMGKISEWEVEVKISADQCIRPGILISHISDIAQAVAEHERELPKNHSIVVSHG